MDKYSARESLDYVIEKLDYIENDSNKEDVDDLKNTLIEFYDDYFEKSDIKT